jgi:probable rRNA maturation factor
MLFYYDDEKNVLTDRTRANIEKSACIAIAKELGIEDANLLPLELGITVVDKDEIKSINAEYRGIDKVTDVLSFPQFESAEDLAEALSDIEDCEDCETSEDSEDSEDAEDCEPEYTIMLGDVVLCYDKACEQAIEYETGTERELVYLTVHSILHLLGYDHMEEEEKRIMRAREEEIMNEIGIHRNNR